MSESRLAKFGEVTKDLKHITRHGDETEGIRIENMIGFAHVPLGLAGPLQIHGHYQKASVVAPLATVEATLVAGVGRGCKAFQAGGGVHAFAMSEGMGRAPVFTFRSVDDAVAFYKRLPSLKDQLRADAEATSRFASLLRITPHIMGKRVHVHFEFQTGDAAGQNMTEFASVAACAKLLDSELGRELRIVNVIPEGNMTSDKKGAGAKAVRNPRGVQVMAWGTISREVCQNVLRCNPEELVQGLRVAEEGAVRNSLDGSAINVSNLLTAMFIACGQDAASVIESSWAHMTAEYDVTSGQDLSVSMFLPSVIVGSVGGGTGYPTQKEALKMIGCAGPGRKWALAETMAAFALAADISVGAAVASNTHASAHYSFARESKL